MATKQKRAPRPEGQNGTKTPRKAIDASWEEESDDALQGMVIPVGKRSQYEIAVDALESLEAGKHLKFQPAVLNGLREAAKKRGVKLDLSWTAGKEKLIARVIREGA